MVQRLFSACAPLIARQPGIVTAGIITMCTDVAMWFRSDGPLDADEVAETYVALVLRGIDR